MLVPKRILLATDFSDSARHALDFALDLARKMSASVEILHVVHPVEGNSYSPLRYSPEAAAIQARTSISDRPSAIVEQLLEYATDGLDVTGVEIRLNQRKGLETSDLIVDEAHTVNTTYIVLGTHSHSAIHRLLVGSVVSDVVRHADCPVLVVPHHGETAEPPENGKIVVPVDFSPGTADQIQAAARLARYLHLELELYHVIEPFTLPVSLTGFRTIYELVPDIEQRVVDKMRSMAETIPGLPFDILYRTGNGHAAACIVEESERPETAALVLAAHGGTGLQRFFVGSVSERVVRSSHRPVLIVPVSHLAEDADLDREEDISVV